MQELYEEQLQVQKDAKNGILPLESSKLDSFD
jgi:hypothetical protein